LYLAVRKGPAEARLTDMQRDVLFDGRYGELIKTMRSDLDRLSAELGAQRELLSAADSQIGELRAQLSVARDDALAARTKEAEANIEVAKVRAQLAEAQQQASEERHALRNDFQAELIAKDLQIQDLQRQVGDLVLALESLKARMDPRNDGRRASDPPVEDESP
jgi:chromosome segregation ATPase